MVLFSEVIYPGMRLEIARMHNFMTRDRDELKNREEKDEYWRCVSDVRVMLCLKNNDSVIACSALR